MIKILSTLLALVILATGCENRSKIPEKNLHQGEQGEKIKKTQQDKLDKEDFLKELYQAYIDRDGPREGQGLEFLREIGFDKAGLKDQVYVLDSGHDLALDYPLEKASGDPVTGLYVYKDRLYMLATVGDFLVLRLVDKEGNLQDLTLAENVAFILPLYTYDKDMFYYSYLSPANQSCLAELNLETKEGDVLLEESLECSEEKGICSGLFVSMLARSKKGLVYQLSEFKEGRLLDSKPVANQLIFVDRDFKELGRRDSKPLDSYLEVEGYGLAHNRNYGKGQSLILYDDKDQILLEEDLEGPGLRGGVYFNYQGVDYILLATEKTYVINLQTTELYEISQIFDKTLYFGL